MLFLVKLILRISGWKVYMAEGLHADRCVMIASPHTSNWDLWYMILAFKVFGIPLRFTIKKEWMKFPFNLLMRPLGAIGIDRSPKVAGQKRKSMVESMADLFDQNDKLAVVVTPEGSRSLRTEWKTGFYYVAKSAGVPVCCGYLDYAKKEAGVGMEVFPSEDAEADLAKIMAFYKPIGPKFPEKFSIDTRYDRE